MIHGMVRWKYAALGLMALVSFLLSILILAVAASARGTISLNERIVQCPVRIVEGQVEWEKREFRDRADAERCWADLERVKAEYEAWAKQETIWNMAPLWERLFRDAIADARSIA